MRPKNRPEETPAPRQAGAPSDNEPPAAPKPRAQRRRKPAGQELVRRLPVSDDELLGLLEDARKAGATALHPASAPEHEAAIAHLECELAARGIDLTAGIEERMPGRVVFEVFLKALVSRDEDAAARAIRNLPHGALWLACRRIRESSDRRFRIHCLSRVLYRLDVCLLSLDSATARQEALADSHLDEHDLEAFVEQCLASMFGTAFSYGPRYGENYDAR
jgi:hypothetical protein